jgi:hypothetical protein
MITYGLFYAGGFTMIKNFRKRKREILLPILTILITAIIIAMAGVIRVRVKAEKVELPIESSKIAYEEAKLYLSESQILSTLMNGEEDMKRLPEIDAGTLPIYINCLKSYLDITELSMSQATYAQLKDKIVELIEIMNIEQENDFTKMSLDGRAVAVDIAGQIYKLCGLELFTDMDGNIKQVADPSGNLIYQSENMVSVYHFQITVFIITISIILLLLIVIFLIGKKNNLFQKEVSYDEFDEKRFA